jgi:site-specific recombinase XerD
MLTALRAVVAMVDSSSDVQTFPWHELDYAHVAAIRARLAERHAPATGNRILCAVRGVIKTAFKLALVDSDHMARACGVEPIRGSRVMKGRALSSGELRALFAACDARTPGGARNAALLGLLYGSGLRRSEVVALDMEHFELATSKLLVNGKGNRQRTVYVTNGAREALDAWLEHRGHEPGPLLHPVLKGGRIVRRRMSDQAVFEFVQRLARKADVARFSPHDCRRTMIGDSLDAGADLISLQALVGHASPTTVVSGGQEAREFGGVTRWVSCRGVTRCAGRRVPWPREAGSCRRRPRRSRTGGRGGRRG